MQNNSRLKDPGIIMTVVLVIVSLFVLVWWPTDMYIMGISLAGWLMFLSYFVWFLLAIIYVIWIEKKEEKENR